MAVINVRPKLADAKSRAVSRRGDLEMVIEHDSTVSPPVQTYTWSRIAGKARHFLGRRVITYDNRLWNKYRLAILDVAKALGVDPYVIASETGVVPPRPTTDDPHWWTRVYDPAQ